MVGGSCLCGDVAWEVPGPCDFLYHCHCSICRKFHGASFATLAAAPAAGFRFVRGSERLRRYATSPGNERPFCERCGSPTPSEPTGERVILPAGALDDDPGARPVAHIFAASKAPWHEIADTLPRFDTMPPGFPEPQLASPDRNASEPGCTRGSCLCGRVAWELAADLELLRNCHCSRCRTARGAAYATNAFHRADAFRWLRGEDARRSFKVPEAERFTHVFCGVCSSTLPRVEPTLGAAVMPVGSIDGDVAGRPRVHIFVDSKAPWHEILDALPQHPQSAPF